MCITVKPSATEIFLKAQPDSVCNKKDAVKTNVTTDEGKCVEPEDSIKRVKVSLGKAVNSVNFVSDKKDITPKTEANDIPNYKKKYDSVLGNYAVGGNILFQGLIKGGKAITPVGHTLGGLIITAFDISTAVDKTKDLKVNNLSKALAWSAVACDAISISSNYKVVSKPLGFAADGAGMVARFWSDVESNKK
jgi:hypothetical protein